MYKARFLYDIYEEKYAIKPFGKIDDWKLGEVYFAALGYFDNNVCRYIKLIEEDKAFHEEDLNVEFEIGNKVKIGNEKVKITDVVKNLDGSIDYKTNKKEFISLNTYETYFDERPKEEKSVEDEELQEVKIVPMDKKEPFWKGYKSINKYFRKQ
jgi:hypothetical protein